MNFYKVISAAEMRTIQKSGGITIEAAMNYIESEAKKDNSHALFMGELLPSTIRLLHDAGYDVRRGSSGGWVVEWEK